MSLNHDCECCSDHLRCRIHLSAEDIRPRRPFKFVNAVADLEGFLPLMEDYWKDTEPILLSTSSMFRFCKKLKCLKPKIKVLAKERMGNLVTRTKEAFEDLCAKQENNFNSPSSHNMEEENRAYKRWEHISSIEEKFLKQKSKLHWLKVGDKNNKYFHKGVVERAALNTIREIKCRNGTVVCKGEEIKKEAEGFFRDFMQHKPEDFIGISVTELEELIPRCSDADHSQLVRGVSAEEIQKVLFSMPSDKSPGPDGYTSEFFKKAWTIIGAEFTIAVQSFFEKGFLPKGVNTTILALIPKKTDASKMKDYRPISCCNVMYKVISKILANRLKKILPNLISLNQSAFIQDRLLIESLLLATELVKDYHKDSVSSRCAIKIDISKAFDSVQWDFLFNTLSAMNLPERFIHWICLCVTTASFSVQVNGELVGFFRSERGLRQGCSLSPYLFVICMNVLSKMLDKAGRNSRIGFHPKCKNNGITHLSFADDIMVFTDGKARSVEGIVNVFDEFAKASGLRINMQKSTIYFAGVTDAVKADIQNMFAFDSGELPVRYLGLPLLTRQMSSADYLPLLEKIRGRITSWKSRFLSFAGRLELIQSVLFSLTNFWMSAFRLPSACLCEIEQLCSAFLWSGPALNAHKAKISWSDLCKPRKEGGLGIRPLKEVNMVCCLKMIWRIVSSHSSLWVSWIKTHLIRQGSFWSVKESTSLGSWVWRKLLKHRDEARQFYRVDAQNGRNTSFWFDAWTPLGPLHTVTGPRGSIDMGIPIHATVADATSRTRRRKHRTEKLREIETLLHEFRERATQTNGISLWKHSTDVYRKKFSSKKTWGQLREEGLVLAWPQGIWFTHATPKYSFVAWLAAHNRLSTGDRISSWSATVDSSCILCQSHMETRDHLFFSCTVTSGIWYSLTKGLLNTSYSSDWQHIIALISDGAQQHIKLFLLRYVFQAAIHSLWTERNRRRHGEQPHSSQQLTSGIDKHVRNRLSTVRSLGDTKYEEALQIWFEARS